MIRTILIFHAIFGGISLIAGLVAMLSKKGQSLHLKSGLIYYWAMMLVVITGVILGFYSNNTFILTIAVFSFYLVYTGRMTLRFKSKVIPKPIDWFFNILSIIIASYMIYLVIINVPRIGFAGTVPMLLVFGGILLLMSIQDFQLFRKKKFVKGEWLLTHIGRMGGSYIATSTAFLVVNIKLDPIWIIWLLPTVVGTPLIFMAGDTWKKKMKIK